MLLFISIESVMGQTYRPKVGLVLSGGSAHGLAHIGVIKYLEEQGIPVDYVTGTSMGSIVGGLYAMGHTSEEIAQIAYEQEWDYILSNRLPQDAVAPSEKRYHDRHAIEMTLSNGRVSLPQGLVNGQRLDLVLNQLYSGVYNYDSFDELPRPFRCVAVDIESGDVKTFDRGFLAEAIRASMSIPSLFVPARIDDRLYVDGGLIRNFPVEEVKTLGADIIIGVYVGKRLDKSENLNSLTDILTQSAFMMGILDSEEQKKAVDVLIEPDVKSYPSLDFDLADLYIQRGYEAAKSHAEVLRKVKEKLSAFDIDPKDKIRSHDAFQVSKISFSESPQSFEKLAKFKFGDTRKSNYKVKEIEGAISRIFGTKYFDYVTYKLRDKPNGRKEIDILAPPKKGVELYANMNYMNTTGTSILVQSDIRNVLGSPSVLIASARISEKYALGLNYNYRMGGQKDFLLLVDGALQNYNTYGYEGNTLRADYNTIEYTARGGLAFEPNNSFWVGVRGGVNAVKLIPKGIIPNGLKDYFRSDIVLKSFLEYNTLDARAWPEKGWRVYADLSYNSFRNRKINAGEGIIEAIPDAKSYLSFLFLVQRTQPITSFLFLDLHLYEGYKNRPSLMSNHVIGGIESRYHQNLLAVGMKTGQLHFSEYTNIGAELRFKLSESWYLSGKYDLFTGERAFLYLNSSEDKKNEWHSFGGILGVRSPIGPLRLAVGYNTYTKSIQTNLAIGYSFF